MVKNKRSRSILLLFALAITCQVAYGVKCDTSKKNIDHLRQIMAAAVTHEAKGEHTDAIQLLESVRTTGCWEPIHSLFLGQIYIKTGQYTNAIQQLVFADSESVTDIDLYTSLGESYFRIGDYQKAIKAITKGINERINETKLVMRDANSSVVDPTLSELYAQRADIYSAEGNKKLAINDLRIAIQMHPYNTTAHTKLDKLLKSK